MKKTGPSVLAAFVAFLCVASAYAVPSEIISPTTLATIPLPGPGPMLLTAVGAIILLRHKTRTGHR